VNTQHLYQRVASQLADEIDHGNYTDTGKLPSIKALTARFQCSQMTTRAALRLLIAQGYIEVHQGVGSVIPRRRSRQARIEYKRARVVRKQQELQAAVDDLLLEMRTTDKGDAA
jgi:DNA-binding GntR family transcriptional regulator